MRWTIGEVTVTKVVEVEHELPLSGLLPSASLEALAPHASWLMPHFIDDEGMTDLSIHAFVIESDGRRIIVDTCVGDRDMAGLPGFTGDSAFLKRLTAAGYPPESIDIVCCTHLHFDHVGWNTRREDDRWVPTFPNARYLFCRAEYDAWMAEPGGYAWNLPDTVAPVVEAGLVDLVEPDHNVTAEVRFVPTPGHSPGHMSVLIDSEGSRALITGDATHHPVQWAETGWGMSGDWDGEQATATRDHMRSEFGGNGTLILGTHYSAPSVGHIVENNGAWEFHASHETTF
jgi:glyoxylase-like metal-dependent hydrolase (beta-lactamase superfamily II)